jgi:AcrR family transcriptional regulator
VDLLLSSPIAKVSKQKAERIGQKERTRQKLLSAARALVEEGETLTIARAAERANIAEATAYRYYRNSRSLLRDALSIDWSALNDVLAALSILPSAADRACTRAAAGYLQPNGIR